jgi:AraC-like DNA-binding protein
MRIHLTRSLTLAPFTSFLEAGGCSTMRHLSAVGIDSDILQSPESLFPLTQGCQFIERAARWGGGENIGIEVGAQTPIREMGLFGKVLQQALTLKDLLQKLIQWVPLVDTGARVWLITNTDAEHVRLCVQHDVHTGRSVANDFALMLFIDAVRMATGPNWRPRQVSAGKPRQRQLSTIDALSDARFEDNSVLASFLIPRNLLSKPILRSSPADSGDSNPEDTLKADAPPDDLIGSMTQAIRSGLHSRIPTINEAAELAGTSVRTLQRNLGTLGIAYRELLDRIRFEEATTQLGDPSIPIRDIASRLGYSEISNFSHAFLRWAGTPPSSYRAQRIRGNV